MTSQFKLHLILGLLVLCATPLASQHRATLSDDPWVQHVFDFDVEGLGFVASVPDDAQIETVQMTVRNPDSAGNIKIVGKISAAAVDFAVDTTIVAYDLAVPGNANRFCEFEAEKAGYELRGTRTASDFSAAEIFAMEFDGGRPGGAVFSQCMVRGHMMIAFHFMYDLTTAQNQADVTARFRVAERYYRKFMASITFSDGRNRSFFDGLASVPLMIGADPVSLYLPDVWDVPINDFTGPLPAELNLLQENTDGQSVGQIWLSVQERRTQPDLEVLGPVLFADFFTQQSSQVAQPVLLYSGVDQDLATADIVAHHFRFAAKTHSGAGRGDIQATLIWHGGRLYALGFWSNYPVGADYNTFLARLPGLTSYDMIGRALIAMLDDD